MITIRNNNVEIKVTKGVYDNLYKNQGFEIVKENVKEVVNTKIKDAVIEEPVVKKNNDIVPPMKEEKIEKDDFEAFILNELKADKDEKPEKSKKA